MGGSHTRSVLATANFEELFDIRDFFGHCGGIAGGEGGRWFLAIDLNNSQKKKTMKEGLENRRCWVRSRKA